MTRKAAQTTHDLRVLENTGADKWGANLKLKSRGNLTWRDADPAMLLEALAAATEDGAALLLSKTSDGGALSIHVLTNGGTHKLYPATAEELREGLQLIVKIAF